MIDAEGYRENVGIILFNRRGRLFWAKRSYQRAWQFPQGGIASEEMPIIALYRELYEEIGLRPWQVKIVAATQGWLKYQLPEQYQHRDGVRCVGQKQKWFLLEIDAPDGEINLCRMEEAEFDDWAWVDYWYPVEHVISFKRYVYRNALERFYPIVNTIRSLTISQEKKSVQPVLAKDK